MQGAVAQSAAEGCDRATSFRLVLLSAAAGAEGVFEGQCRVAQQTRWALKDFGNFCRVRSCHQAF